MLTPSRGGVRFFQHTQSVPSTTWTIFHGFGTKPLVDTNVLEEGVMQKAFPLSIVHTDENNVVIQWTVPRTGTVSLASTIA